MGKQARKSLAQPSPSKDNRPRDTTPNGPFSPAELRFNIGKANGNLDCGEISEPISTHPIMPRNHSKSKDGSASQPNRPHSRGQKSKNASHDITSQKKTTSKISSDSKETQISQIPKIQLEAHLVSTTGGA